MKSEHFHIMISLCVLLVLSCAGASAQDMFPWGEFPGFGDSRRPVENKRVKWVYDACFDYKFDNREFDAGGEKFTESMTLYGARLTPSAGLEVRGNRAVTHRLMLGIDIMKEYGRHPVADSRSTECDKGLENVSLFREMTMYYGIDAKINSWNIKGYAGVFPRAFVMGDYSQAFFSDSLKFYDNNLEGLLVKASSPKSYMELAFDWCGKIGSYRREQFNVFGYGDYKPNDWFSAGMAFKYHHWANAQEWGSVVDDALLCPFVKFDFGRACGLRELSASLLWYQAVQQDRRSQDGIVNRSGVELAVAVRHWSVGVENRTYYGRSLMPFYNYVTDTDVVVEKYGNNLYGGSPFYRVKPGSSDAAGVYDRLEVWYQPHIADFLDLRLSVVAHFPDNFRFEGTQQKISLIFSLDKLLRPEVRKSAGNRIPDPRRRRVI